MSYTPTAAHSLAVTFKLDGAMAATTLLVKNTTWDEKVAKLITTHSGSGGKEAVIAGILSGDGTVEANVDTTVMPQAAAPGIVAGAKGTLTWDNGGVTPWSIHVMITQINWRGPVDGLLTYNFNCCMDSSSGAYVRAATA